MKGPVRLGGLVAVALGVAAVAGLPLARGQSTSPAATVAASGTGSAPKRFSPDPVTVQVGDTVQWTNAGGFHNVHFDDGTLLPGPPSTDAWTVSRRFDAPGTYTYFCDAHKSVGMTGTVVVTAAPGGSPGPTATPAPSATPVGGAPAPAPARLRSLRVLRTHFCTQRTRNCKKPGVVLAIDLSAPAAVRGTLTRAPLHGAAHYRRFGSVDFGRVGAGARQLRFSRTQAGRRLAPARYRLVVSAAGASRTLRFRVRPS